jgi:hypothetical protein
MTIEDTSPDVIDEIGTLRFAWDRLDPHDRRSVASGTVRAALRHDTDGGLARASEVALATALATAVPFLHRLRPNHKPYSGHNGPEDTTDNGQ